MNEPLHLPNAYERERDTKLRDDARAAAVGFRALGRGADAVRMDEVAEFHASKLLPRTVALLSVQTWRAGPDDEGYPTRRPDDYEVVVHCGCGVEPKTMTTNEAQADINCQGCGVSWDEAIMAVLCCRDLQHADEAEGRSTWTREGALRDAAQAALTTLDSGDSADASEILRAALEFNARAVRS